MPDTREKIFSYIYAKADEVGYMGLDSAASNKFQDDLQADPKLLEIAGEQLSRNYIKDTVLNNYSKLQRYISKDDVASVFVDLDVSNIFGVKRDFENGLFYIELEGEKIECTSSSFGEWQTVIKRFGEYKKNVIRFAFLTCGGIVKDIVEVEEVKRNLRSYGVHAFIVKPSESPVSIKSFLPKLIQTSVMQVVMSEVKSSKPFFILAGVSGTGKTRFVREQSLQFNIKGNYCLVPVRPDWHEPSDLLGYFSRMGSSPEYVCTDTLRFIVSAWKHIIQDVKTNSNGDYEWEGKDLNDIKPFWLCLDEMNLAPVEQYFSDFLSVLETRRWYSLLELSEYNQNNGTSYKYIYKSDPILKADVISQLNEAEKQKMAKALGLELSNYNEKGIWDYFCQSGIAIPFNLMVAGTVNMDETTHGFSRKVIDRALSFDFGDFFPNDFDHFFMPETKSLTFSYPVWSDGRDVTALENTIDPDGSRTTLFLKKVNSVLEGTSFKLAFRALNELLLSVIAIQPKTETALFAVWDDFIMTKVLPRIEGDVDKLSTQNYEVGHTDRETVLDDLSYILLEQLGPIWEGESRPDLYREYLVEKNGSKTIFIACRSKSKLAWMKKRLESATFTSFWP